MTRRIRVVGVPRKDIDEDKLALAFLMLATTARHVLAEDEAESARDSDAPPTDKHANDGRSSS